MFFTVPTHTETNLRFSHLDPEKQELRKIIESQKTQLDTYRYLAWGIPDKKVEKLEKSLAEATAALEASRNSAAEFFREMSAYKESHRTLHQEKQDLYNEVCSLRRQLAKKDGTNPILDLAGKEVQEEQNVVFRLKPHAYQSQKLRSAIREVWPSITLPPVSIQDLVITCTVLDFVKFLMARDAWGAQNNWKDINAHFQKPKKKEGPSHRIDLT